MPFLAPWSEDWTEMHAVARAVARARRARRARRPLSIRARYLMVVGVLVGTMAGTLLGCCNPPGHNVSGKFRAEREAVEAAMEARKFPTDLSDEPVYEYAAPSPVCPDDARGCCVTGWCPGIFVPDRPEALAGGATLLPADAALHEYVHRAIIDAGWQPADGPEHPLIFWTVWNEARAARQAAARP